MENEKISQMDLFSQDNSPAHAGNKNSASFMSRIWKYEKAILLIFVFLITGIISFSLGVEKGKRIALESTNTKLDIALQKTDSLPKLAMNRKVNAAQSKVNPNLAVSQKKVKIKQGIKEESTKQSKPEDYNKYTIQLASYKTKSQAQIEIAKLKRKGFLPVVISKSGYSVVCVGNFPNKQTAQSYLSKLKNNYKDCFIRRL